jgi:hypothetical protein
MCDVLKRRLAEAYRIINELDSSLVNKGEYDVCGDENLPCIEVDEWLKKVKMEDGDRERRSVVFSDCCGDRHAFINY